MKEMAERRRSPRHMTQQMVQISGVREELLNASSIDISEHGLSCICKDSVEPSDRLSLMLLLADCRSIQAESMVTRAQRKKQRYELGFEFVSMPPADAKALKQFLGNHSEF
jgi:c-di-GMP-binding flagellar brake protein YcgR